MPLTHLYCTPQLWSSHESWNHLPVDDLMIAKFEGIYLTTLSLSSLSSKNIHIYIYIRDVFEE